MENNSHKLNKLYYLLYFALFLLLIVLSIYFFNFNNGFSTDKEDWGTFGDFIGGTLNPLFAFLSLFAIIYTIKIQTQELEYTREELQATKEELSKSRIAQEEQSEAFKIQNLSISQQTFENTFFKLLEHHNELIGEFYVEAKGLYKKIVLEEYKKKLVDSFLENNTGIVKTYFMTLYQILKFIDNHSNKFKDKSIFDSKLYTNIIRATFDDTLLCLLVINCSIKEFEQFKILIEKYNFLEHLNIKFTDSNGLELRIIDAMFIYEDCVFGDNTHLKNEVAKIKKARIANEKLHVEHARQLS